VKLRQIDECQGSQSDVAFCFWFSGTLVNRRIGNRGALAGRSRFQCRLGWLSKVSLSNINTFATLLAATAFDLLFNFSFKSCYLGDNILITLEK
jgi:hypothetical protein